MVRDEECVEQTLLGCDGGGDGSEVLTDGQAEPTDGHVGVGHLASHGDMRHEVRAGVGKLTRV